MSKIHAKSLYDALALLKTKQKTESYASGGPAGLISSLWWWLTFVFGCEMQRRSTFNFRSVGLPRPTATEDPRANWSTIFNLPHHPRLMIALFLETVI